MIALAYCFQRRDLIALAALDYKEKLQDFGQYIQLYFNEDASQDPFAGIDELKTQIEFFKNQSKNKDKEILTLKNYVDLIDQEKKKLTRHVI